MTVSSGQLQYLPPQIYPKTKHPIVLDLRVMNLESLPDKFYTLDPETDSSIQVISIQLEQPLATNSSRPVRSIHLNQVKLTRLQLDCNFLTSLPDLSSLTSLLELSVRRNQLGWITNWPPNLVTANLEYNELVQLPDLPASLNILLCFSNRLTSLPKNYNQLGVFACHDNPCTKPYMLPIINHVDQ